MGGALAEVCFAVEPPLFGALSRDVKGLSNRQSVRSRLRIIRPVDSTLASQLTSPSLWAELQLRPVMDGDLPILFEYQADPKASAMAGLASRDPQAFAAHWTKIRSDPQTILRTIVVGNEVAGSVLSFNRNDVREVGYWLGRDHWGKGIASAALARFLVIESTRPLFAGVITHNSASVRVLEKCGFQHCGVDDGYFILKLA